MKIIQKFIFKRNRKKLLKKLRTEIFFINKFTITYNQLLNLYYKRFNKINKTKLKEALDLYLIKHNIKPLTDINKELEEEKKLNYFLSNSVKHLKQDVKDLYSQLTNCQELLIQNREDYDVIETNLDNKLKFLTNLLKEAPKKKRSKVIVEKKT